MNIGWHDICLKTSDIQKTRAFYEALGMEVRVDQPHWVALTNGNLHISLMTFIGNNLITFRGSDVNAVYDAVKKAGIAAETAPETYAKAQMGSDGIHWKTRDPEGNVVYFDTTNDEAERSAQVRVFLESTERQLRTMGLESSSFEAFKRELTDRYL